MMLINSWFMCLNLLVKLLGDESHAVAELEVFMGKQVKVHVESLYTQEQFDVVMM